MVLHAIMRALPDDAREGPKWSTPAGEIPTLAVDSAGLPFDTTFEAAAARFQQHPRAYFELDGSLLLTGWRDEWFWRLEGNLYDRNDALLFVDLRIDCPRDVFLETIEALTPGAARFFELPSEGVLLRESALLEYAFPAR